MKRCANCGTELPDDFPLQPVDNGSVPAEPIVPGPPSGTFRLEPWCVPCTRPPIAHDGVMTP